MRTRLEHIELRWGDVELCKNSVGEEYLQYTERATKTRTGQTNDSRPFQPKMFADPGRYNKEKNIIYFYDKHTTMLYISSIHDKRFFSKHFSAHLYFVVIL